MSPTPLEFTISPATPSDFLALSQIEHAAFSGPMTNLMFSPSSTPSITTSRHLSIISSDPTAHYMKASLPDGQTIGLAKWNFFTTPGPHFPWPKEKEAFAPDANMECLRWFFASLDEKRNRVMVERGRGYVYMAILAMGPEWQRMGVGKRLLEWGLEKADREEVEAWIEASPAGKGLYEKMGWKEVGFVDLEMGMWGGEDGLYVERGWGEEE